MGGADEGCRVTWCMLSWMWGGGCGGVKNWALNLLPADRSPKSWPAGRSDRTKWSRPGWASHRPPTAAWRRWSVIRGERVTAGPGGGQTSTGLHWTPVTTSQTRVYEMNTCQQQWKQIQWLKQNKYQNKLRDRCVERKLQPVQLPFLNISALFQSRIPPRPTTTACASQTRTDGQATGSIWPIPCAAMAIDADSWHCTFPACACSPTPTPLAFTPTALLETSIPVPLNHSLDNL